MPAGITEVTLHPIHSQHHVSNSKIRGTTANTIHYISTFGAKDSLFRLFHFFGDVFIDTKVYNEFIEDIKPLF